MNTRPSMEKRWLQFYPKGANEKEIPCSTLYQNYIEHNKKYPDHITIEYFGKKYTVKELMSDVENAKKVFNRQGLKEGDSVSVAMLTTPDFVITAFALNDMGVRVDLVDYVSQIDVTLKQQKSINDKILIIHEELIDNMKELIDAKGYKTIITSSIFDATKSLKSKGLGMLSSLTASDDRKSIEKSSKTVKLYEQMDQYKNDLSVMSAPYKEGRETFVIYSSGSSNGIPTAYVTTDDGINATIYDHEPHVSNMNFTRGQRFLNVLPSIYSTTITSSLFMPLVLGQTVILDPRFDKDLFPKQLDKYHPNHWIVNQTHTKEAIYSGIDLTKAINPIVGGEAFDVNLEKIANLKIYEQHMAKLNSNSYKLIKSIKSILNIKEVPNTKLENREPTKWGKGYGSSPFGACVTVTNSRCNKIGTSGIPLPHITIGIFDPDTNEELGYDQFGEIRVMTPAAVKRVVGDDQGINKIYQYNEKYGEVWGHSGDIGRLDSEGRLYVKGRMDDSYLDNGVRKYPFEIDEKIGNIIGVAQCKTVRIENPNDNANKINVAHIKLDDSEFDICDMTKEIIGSCSEQLDMIKFRDSFPTSSSGKIDTISLKSDIENLISMSDNEEITFNNLNQDTFSSRGYQLYCTIIGYDQCNESNNLSKQKMKRHK